MDEIFEVDAAAVLCEVSETAVAHWNGKRKTVLRHRDKRPRCQIQQAKTSPPSLDHINTTADNGGSRAHHTRA